MTLSRETQLGTISVSNLFFAQIIADSFKLDSCKGKVWPATKKGRQIGSDMKFNLSDYAANIEVEESKVDGRVHIEFCVIVKFGASISGICEDVVDHVAAQIARRHGQWPAKVTARVTGVKSKQIAKRNVEVVREYGIEG